MPEPEQDETPQIPPPPPRQPDERLKGYIERENEPGATTDQKDRRTSAR